MADNDSNSDRPSADYSRDDRLEDSDDIECEYEYSDVEDDDLEDTDEKYPDNLDDRDESRKSNIDNVANEHEIEYNVQDVTADQLFELCRGGVHSFNDYHNAERYLMRNRDAARVLSDDGMHPLHVACSNDAPFSLICALYKAWPDSVRVQGRRGALPLHEACKCGTSLATIQFLIDVWLDSIRVFRNENNYKLWPLHDALSNDTVDLEIIRYLVNAWPESVKSRIHDDMVAVHWACKNGVSFSVIRFLAEEWPESVRLNGNYGLPLHRTCAQPRHRVATQIVEYLIQLWPDSVKVRDQHGVLPLHEACRIYEPDPELIGLLIAVWPEGVRVALQDGQLPLHLACRNHASFDVLQLLVETWPEAVLVSDKSAGFLPLHYKCKRDPDDSEQRSLDDIKVLVQASPETLEIRAFCGSLPLHLACSHPIASTEVINYLVTMCAQALRCRDCNGRLPLHVVYEPCKPRPGQSMPPPPPLKTIEVLVKGWPGAVAETDGTGFSPLHYVCNNNTEKYSLDVIKLLVQASPNTLVIPAPCGSLPLHFACTKPISSSEVIRYLTNMGPRALRCRDSKGLLPLHLACMQLGSPQVSETIETLIQGWPEAASVRDQHGKLPLNCAFQNQACKSSLDIIKVLVQSSPDTLTVSDLGGALHSACAKPIASTEVINYLVTMCPQALRCKDGQGRLPLHIACSQFEPPASFETIQILVNGWRESVQEIYQEHIGTATIPWSALDQVCHFYNRGYTERPSERLIRLLTNDMPPLHFAATFSASNLTAEYLIMKFRDDLQHFYYGMLPIHCACHAGASHFILNTWLKPYPQAVAMATTDTGNLPLHCYLSCPKWSSLSTTTTTNQDTVSCVAAVKYLVNQYPASLSKMNRTGCLPFHVAAMNDSPLDVLFHLVREAPDPIVWAKHCQE